MRPTGASRCANNSLAMRALNQGARGAFTAWWVVTVALGQELTEAGSDPREVFVEPLKKWFDVRSRYLQ